MAESLSIMLNGLTNAKWPLLMTCADWQHISSNITETPNKIQVPGFCVVYHYLLSSPPFRHNNSPTLTQYKCNNEFLCLYLFKINSQRQYLTRQFDAEETTRGSHQVWLGNSRKMIQPRKTHWGLAFEWGYYHWNWSYFCKFLGFSSSNAFISWAFCTRRRP